MYLMDMDVAYIIPLTEVEQHLAAHMRFLKQISAEGSNITTLDLSNNSLHKWNVGQIRAFAQGLQGSNINTLDLSNNRLNEWNARQISAFAQGLEGTQIATLIIGSSEIVACNTICMINDLIAQINSVEPSEMTDELYTAIESLDDLLSLLSLLETGTDRPDNTSIPDTINDGYTAILAMLFKVEENFVLFVKYLDKIAYISDDTFAFRFAAFLAFEQPTKLLFYRLVEKVNLDDKDLRVICNRILAGDEPYRVFEDDLMTADEIRDEAARQLSGLLKEDLYAGHYVIENYYSDQSLSEEEEKSIEIVDDIEGVPLSVINTQERVYENEDGFHILCGDVELRVIKEFEPQKEKRGSEDEDSKSERDGTSPLDLGIFEEFEENEDLGLDPDEVKGEARGKPVQSLFSGL